MSQKIENADTLDTWKAKINNGVLGSPYSMGFTVDYEQTAEIATPLDIFVKGGKIKNGTDLNDVADLDITLPDDTVSIIALDARTGGAEALVRVDQGSEVSNSKWIELYEVTVAAGVITGIVDIRPVMVV